VIALLKMPKLYFKLVERVSGVLDFTNRERSMLIFIRPHGQQRGGCDALEFRHKITAALSRKVGRLKTPVISMTKHACVHRCVTWRGALDQPSHLLAKSKWLVASHVRDVRSKASAPRPIGPALVGWRRAQAADGQIQTPQVALFDAI
jgi:hypothetical protein